MRPRQPQNLLLKPAVGRDRKNFSAPAAAGPAMMRHQRGRRRAIANTTGKACRAARPNRLAESYSVVTRAAITPAEEWQPANVTRSPRAMTPVTAGESPSADVEPLSRKSDQRVSCIANFRRKAITGTVNGMSRALPEDRMSARFMVTGGECINGRRPPPAKGDTYLMRASCRRRPADA